VGENGRGTAEEELRRQWSGAQFSENDRHILSVGGEAFKPHLLGEEGSLHLHVRGTNFQIKVWEALLHVPPGSAVSYGELAVRIGKPAAARAVGSAVGRNPVSLVIPCHRVIRETGALGGYRWGETRKRLLLGWESANRHLLLRTD
jgi:AraC family transcriptional regulator of adaptative response/methylated-DNA-[protein]-cysteine methyltransferase